MVGGRYVTLMDASVDRVTKSVSAAGLTLTCLEAVNLVEQTLPGIFVVPRLWHADFLWRIDDVDKLRSDKRVYRRFAQEGDIARSIFVLTCPKADQKFELEIIPPSSELERLRILSQGREVDMSVALTSRDRYFVTAGRAERIEGWINFEERDLQQILELASQEDVRISLFEAGLEYRLISDMATFEKISGILATNRSNIENAGGIRTLSFAVADVIRDCHGFRSAG
jgi:hypothetical protein